MSLTLVTGPQTEPLTLEEAKAQLRLDSDEDDALVRRLLLAARMWVEGQTHRALIEQTWDQNLPYFPTLIRFEKNPVMSVTSITYNEGSSPVPTLAASQYQVVARTHASYVSPAYGVSWPSTRNVPEAVTVRFVAGYTDVPEPLKHAVAMLVAHWYENREVTTHGTVSEVPLAVEALISPYRC